MLFCSQSGKVIDRCGAGAELACAPLPSSQLMCVLAPRSASTAERVAAIRHVYTEPFPKARRRPPSHNAP